MNQNLSNQNEISEQPEKLFETKNEIIWRTFISLMLPSAVPNLIYQLVIVY